MKPNNVISLKCEDFNQFIKVWITFLKPFHRLTPSESDVAARILVQYFKLKASVPDQNILYELLWTSKSRKDIMDSLKISRAWFQMVLSTLKSSGFLEGNRINPRYIPHITDESRFLLDIVFDWSSPSKPIDNEKEQK